MTHMQTKSNNKQSIDAMLRIFYRLNTIGKNEMLTTILLYYPENYQEFVENMDKTVYEKFMVRA